MRRKSKFERLSKIQHVVMLDEFLSLRSMRCHAQRDFCRMSVFFVETVAHIDKPFFTIWQKHYSSFLAPPPLQKCQGEIPQRR